MTTFAFRSIRPGPGDFAPFYAGYVAQVPDGDIVGTLADQLTLSVTLLQSISEPQSEYRYAPSKWSIKQLLGHLIDGERVFGFRALWFARGGEGELPSMDQELFVSHAGHEHCSWPELIDEFGRLRASTLDLVRGFDEQAWLRRGIASGNKVSVSGLIWIIAGHELHHIAILREKYLRR